MLCSFSFSSVLGIGIMFYFGIFGLFCGLVLCSISMVLGVSG